MLFIQFIQILFIFITAIFALFFIYMAFDRFIHKKLKTEINNQAISVLQLGVILSSAIIFKAIIIPVINLINIGINQSNINFTRLFENISLVFFFLLIGLIFTVLIIFSALYFFMKLTKIDEFDEIKQNKTYTAIVLSAIILGLSIIMESSIGHLCEIIIPFSKLIQIF